MPFSEAEMRKKQMEFSNILASHVTSLVNDSGVTSLARHTYQTEEQEKLHCIMELDGFHSFDTIVN